MKSINKVSGCVVVCSFRGPPRFAQNHIIAIEHWNLETPKLWRTSQMSLKGFYTHINKQNSNVTLVKSRPL